MLDILWFATIAGVATSPAGQLPLPVVNEDIVVTATLEREERSELPVAVTVIDAEEIRGRQAIGAYELLRTVPGVAVSRSGSPGKVVSLFTRGTESNQTLVLWNGLRLNDPYFGGFDWAFLPTDGVARIEVVRGPASALYGSDAIGGVVQVLSGRRDGGAARIEAGENTYGRLGLNWGADLGRARLDFTGHVRQGDGAAENDFYDGSDAMARLEWAVGADTSMGLLVRSGRSEIGIPVASGAPTPHRRQESDLLQLALPFEVRKGRWRIEGTVGHLEADLLFIDPDAFFSQSQTDAERSSVRSVATYRAGDRLWLAFGGDWAEEKVSDVSNFGPNLEAETRRTWAAFGELQKAWGPVRLDIGARSDHDEFYGSATSPRVGLVVDLPAATQLFASYGEGFRAPSLGELFFPFFGNPELRPEESATWEAGLRHDGERWQASLSAFSTDLENLIDAEPLTFTAVNVGRAEIRGAELEVGYRRGILNVRGNMTWLGTEDLATGEDLLRRPSESASALVSVSPERLVMTLTTRWAGERDDIDPVSFTRARNNAYWVADVALTWQALGRLAPYARVENLSDEAYEEVLGFPAPGRTFIAGLEVGLP
jgi:vitamin B12 transporter